MAILYNNIGASEVFKSSGIKRPTDDLDRIQRIIENADIYVSAWNGEKLIGIARVITDSLYCFITY
jgi:hypothetical protein